MNMPVLTTRRVFTADGPYGSLHGEVWTPAGQAPGREETEQVPIVLMHDSLGSVALWRDFPERLAQATGRTVVAYDRAGFGQSVERKSQLQSSFVADEAREGLLPVMEALGLKAVILFGHSVGGGMSLATAAALPDQVKAVVTVAAQTFVEDRTVEGVRTAKTAFADEAQLGRLARYHGARTRWVLNAWIETWLDPDYAQWSLEAVLPQIKVPVLALHGGNDEYGSARHPEMIAALNGGPVRMKLFDGVGHMPHKEVTDLVLEETARFLAEL